MTFKFIGKWPKFHLVQLLRKYVDIVKKKKKITKQNNKKKKSMAIFTVNVHINNTHLMGDVCNNCVCSVRI